MNKRTVVLTAKRWYETADVEIADEPEVYEQANEPGTFWVAAWVRVETGGLGAAVPA